MREERRSSGWGGGGGGGGSGGWIGADCWGGGVEEVFSSKRGARFCRIGRIGAGITVGAMRGKGGDAGDVEDG